MNLIFNTKRLILRPLEISDAEGMFLLDSNPEVHKFLGNNPVESINESIDYIKNIRKQYHENGIGRFAIILKDTNVFIGWCGIKYITEEDNNHSHFYEIGYRLREDFWGNGFAYEAASFWYNYAFNILKVDILFASAHIDNIGSRRVLEKIGLNLKNKYVWNNQIPCVWYASN